MLFLTLSVEKKLEIGVYVNEKITALAEAIYLLTGKKKRRSHKRWPYKTKNKLPEVQNTAEEVTLESPFWYPPVFKTTTTETTTTETHNRHDYPKQRAYRWFYIDQLKYLGIRDTKYLTGDILTISPSVFQAGKKLNRDFKCSKFWPNTVEVIRTR